MLSEELQLVSLTHVVNVEITVISVMLSKFAKKDDPIAEEGKESIFESGTRKKRENPKLVSVILRCPINIIALIITNTKRTLINCYGK